MSNDNFQVGAVIEPLSVTLTDDLIPWLKVKSGRSVVKTSAQFPKI